MYGGKRKNKPELADHSRASVVVPQSLGHCTCDESVSARHVQRFSMHSHMCNTHAIQGREHGEVIAGAWRRPLFVGGWTHSDDISPLAGETTFNLQTPTVFLDMRVPKAGAARLGHHRGFESMTVKVTEPISGIIELLIVRCAAMI